MSTLIQFRCRAPHHLEATSRGIGAIVMRHGTAAYCGGDGIDERHEWIATGGVALETLLPETYGHKATREGGDVDVSPRAGHISNALRDPRPHASTR